VCVIDVGAMSTSVGPPAGPYQRFAEPVAAAPAREQPTVVASTARLGHRAPTRSEDEGEEELLPLVGGESDDDDDDDDDNNQSEGVAARYVPRCTALYVASLVWSSAFYLVLLTSALFARQTLHAVFMVAGAAMPCIRHRASDGAATGTLPRAHVVRCCMAVSGVLLFASIVVAILSFSGASGGTAVEAVEGYLHVFGIWNPRSHPFIALMAAAMNFTLVLLGCVYEKLLGVDVSNETGPSTADDLPFDRRASEHYRLHKRSRFSRAALALAVSAVTVPSALGVLFFVLHAATIASFCFKRPTPQKFKCLQVLSMVTSLYALAYLLVLLVFQNDVFQYVSLDLSWLGFRFRSFEVLTSNRVEALIFLVHAWAVLEVGYTSRRTHGSYRFLVTAEAETLVDLQEARALRDRKRKWTDALVTGLLLLMVPILVIVVTLVVNVTGFAVMLCTVFGIVARRNQFLSAVPYLYGICATCMTMSLISLVVGGDLQRWMATQHRISAATNDLSSVLGHCAQMLSCALWVAAYSFDRYGSVAEVELTRSALLANRVQKLHDAIDVVKRHLRPLAAYFVKITEGSHVLTRQKFAEMLKQPTSSGLKPSEDEIESLWTALIADFDAAESSPVRDASSPRCIIEEMLVAEGAPTHEASRGGAGAAARGSLAEAIDERVRSNSIAVEEAQGIALRLVSEEDRIFGLPTASKASLHGAAFADSSQHGLRFSGFLELHAETARFRMHHASWVAAVAVLLRDMIKRSAEGVCLLLLFCSATFNPTLDIIRMVFLGLLVIFLCSPWVRRHGWWVLIAYSGVVIIIQYAYTVTYRGQDTAIYAGGHEAVNPAVRLVGLMSVEWGASRYTSCPRCTLGSSTKSRPRRSAAAARATPSTASNK